MKKDSNQTKTNKEILLPMTVKDKKSLEIQVEK